MGFSSPVKNVITRFIPSVTFRWHDTALARIFPFKCISSNILFCAFSLLKTFIIGVALIWRLARFDTLWSICFILENRNFFSEFLIFFLLTGNQQRKKVGKLPQETKSEKHIEMAISCQDFNHESLSDIRIKNSSNSWTKLNKSENNFSVLFKTADILWSAVRI